MKKHKETELSKIIEHIKTVHINFYREYKNCIIMVSCLIKK